jgi:hypothetical protein
MVSKKRCVKCKTKFKPKSVSNEELLKLIGKPLGKIPISHKSNIDASDVVNGMNVMNIIGGRKSRRKTNRH